MTGLALAVSLVLSSPAQALPEGYSYEMVSPPDKGNGEVSGGVNNTGFQASASGDHIIYGADGVFQGAPFLPVWAAYYAHRGASAWQGTAVNALLPTRTLGDLFDPRQPGTTSPFDLSADGRKVIISTNVNPESGELEPGPLYIVDLISGQIERIAPDVQSATPVGLALNGIAGTHDYSTIYFSSDAVLTGEAASPSIPAGAVKLYRYRDGQTELASYSPSGQPAQGVLVDVATIGGVAGNHSVSENGDVAWFYAQQSTGSQIYRADIYGDHSAFVNESENESVVVPPGNAYFADASADGERAFFITQQPLLEQHEGQNNLYMYTHSDDPENDDNLTLISVPGEPADTSNLSVQRVWGVSDDGNTVYFTTSGRQLVEGEPIGAGQKLYRWHDGDLEFLGVTTIFTSAGDHPAAISRTGQLFAFVSGTNGIPVAGDAGGFAQVILYDAADQSFTCMSCPPNGAPATGNAFFRAITTNALALSPKNRNWLSSDGRIFFHSTQPLLPEDTNGKRDVYTWKDGELDLISSGRDPLDSRFADASEDGSTVFFMTYDRLTGWDVDDRADLYAARMGPGVAEPHARPSEPCVGDDCQGPPTAPASSSRPATSDLIRPGGEVVQADCRSIAQRAGQVRARSTRLVRNHKRLVNRDRNVAGRRAQVRRAATQVARTKAQHRRIVRQLHNCRRGNS